MAELGGVSHTSLGDWALCDECKALVESDKRSELVARSVDLFYRRYPDLPRVREVTDLISLTHQKFFQNKGSVYKL